MGKPTPPAAAAPRHDAGSLQPQPSDRFYDHDAPDLDIPDHHDDLPPVYDEAVEAGGSNSLSGPLLPSTATPSVPGANGRPDAPSPPGFLRRDESVSYYVDRRLDSDPDALENLVRMLAESPPRPFVRVYGYHRERRRGQDGKSQNKNVTDFDVKVELTPYLFARGNMTRNWKELDTVENGVKTKRGSVLRRRAPGARKGDGDGGRIELGMAEKPNLTQWCHMYCASHSGLKVFALKRRMLGFDTAYVREQLESMVRRTNYRGRLQITFPVQDETAEVWNECRTNQWRLTKWIYTMFCLSMLWILTWPYLFLRTKRFETVHSDWYFSRVAGDGTKSYVSISENQWYNMWGRAIAKAVMSRRQGVLDQQDLLAAEGADPAFNTGSTTVDGALDFVRAGVSAMNEANRQLGWGEDHY